MQLKSILNCVEPYKSFAYKKVRRADPRTKTTIEILIEPRANGRAICSGCGQRAPGYDRLAKRRFEFVPLWRIAVFFVYAMRRVDCPECGVKVEKVPWCDGKNQLTTTYRWFLARWAKRLSWKGVAEAGEVGVVGHLAVADQLLEADRQGHQAGDTGDPGARWLGRGD